MKPRRFILAILFIQLIGCLTINGLQAQEPEEIFKEANAYYNAGNYDTAVVMYESVVEKFYSSAPLFYNLGNTYYKLKNYPMAIYNYEKALKLDPGNEDIEQNLTLANLHTTDKIEAVPELFLKRWWNGIGDIYSADTWAVISIIAFAVLLIFIFLYFTARTRILKKISFFAGILMIIINICCFIYSSQKKSEMMNQDEAIVMTSTITVKSSPSASSVDLFVLHEGTKVKVLDEADNWNKIKIANGSVGWLPSSAIRKF